MCPFMKDLKLEMSRASLDTDNLDLDFTWIPDFRTIFRYQYKIEI